MPHATPIQCDDDGFPLGLIDEVMAQLPLWSRNHIIFNWATRFQDGTDQDPSIVEIFGTITILNFHHYLKIDEKFLFLAHLPFSHRLAHLDLSQAPIGQHPDLVKFLSHPIFQFLAILNLKETELRSIDPFFNTPHPFPNLHTINLSHNANLEISTISTTSAATTTHPNLFPKLKVLGLQLVGHSTSILRAFLAPTPAASAALATKPQHPSFRLAKLSLTSPDPNTPFPIQSFNSPALSQLKELTLSWSNLRLSDIQFLFDVNTGVLKNLSLLELKFSTQDFQLAFQALAQSPHLSRLTTLQLDGPSFS
jgi:hypothetical protein